jgi:asparagine synthase (glutamine-hydrolysing)
VAREEVKVAITGDGGDEMFAGYGWYERLRQFWALNRQLPAQARRPLAVALSAASHSELLGAAAGLISPRLGEALTTKSHRMLAMLQTEDPRDLYFALRSEWGDQDLVLAADDTAATVLTDGELALGGDDVRVMASYLDMLTFLPEHPLTKVDRATMAVGLEARVPLLDRDVVEFAWRLPMHQRVRDGVTKLLLRRVLYRHVPRELVDRPKVGFAVPLAGWLRGPLRAWAAELLDPAVIRAQGYLDAARVQRAWSEHQAGRRNWERQLWSVVVFQSWLAQQARSVRMEPESAVAG